MSKSTIVFEIANLVIRFGDSGLLDNLTETIYPAMLSSSVPGQGEIKRYLFHKPHVAEIGESKTPMLCGRFVVHMTLKAEQEFDPNSNLLIESSNTMKSAPSSFFAIDLATHRMIWIPETRRSPSLKQFETALTKMLKPVIKKRRNQFRNKYLANLGRQRLPKTEGQTLNNLLNEKFPMPCVRVTPLPAIMDIDHRIDSLTKIQRLTITPLKTNNELPDENEEFLRAYDAQSKRLQASSSHIPFFGGEKGIDHSEAKKILEATSNGNYQSKVSGIAANGEKIKLDMEEISIKITIDKVPNESDSQLADRCFNNAYQAKENGLLFLPKLISNLVIKARNIIKSILEELNE